MERTIFDDYINRFNAKDISTFEDYIDPNARVVNGTLEIVGMQGMKDHYTKIWNMFSEKLHVERFVSDDQTLAIEMRTHFIALKDNDNSLFGKVQVGECFDYHGVIIYQITDNKFTDIKVAYLTFTHTDLEGKTVQLGIPH